MTPDISVLGTVVVGHDGSAGGDAAASWAASLVAQAGGRVLLVHAFEPLVAMEHARPPVDFSNLAAQARQDADGVWAEPLRQAGVAHDCRVVEGPPLDVLAAAAQEDGTGLVVIGSHGRRGWSDRVFGTVVTRLADRLAVPLTVVPLPPPTS